MKTFIKIVSLTIIFAFFKVNAQVSDTLTYVKTFETNKINYIGHPLSKLLNDMTQLQPEFLWTNLPTYSFIKFCNEENLFDTGTVNMVIYWQTLIPPSESEYYESKNDFNFTIEEKNYYQTKIVKNILVYSSN